MTEIYAIATSEGGLPTFFVGSVPDGATRVTAEAFAAAHDAAVRAAADTAAASLPRRTYKADIWRRATDAQAEEIEDLLASAPVRQRRLYEDATYLDHADPLFASLRAAIAERFDAATADALLAPSQG